MSLRKWYLKRLKCNKETVWDGLEQQATDFINQRTRSYKGIPVTPAVELIMRLSDTAFLYYRAPQDKDKIASVLAFTALREHQSASSLARTLTPENQAAVEAWLAGDLESNEKIGAIYYLQVVGNEQALAILERFLQSSDLPKEVQGAAIHAAWRIRETIEERNRETLMRAAGIEADCATLMRPAQYHPDILDEHLLRPDEEDETGRES